MLKIITRMLLSCILAFCTKVYGHTMTLQLAPQESKTIENHLMWALNANCTIHAGTSSKKIKIRMMKEHGKVNGHSLHTGQSTAILVKNQDSLFVTAEAGAQVYLQNLSQEPISANCSA